MMLLAFAAAAAVLPSEADLAGALAQLRGGKPPHVAQAHCAASSPGFVRCTYLETTKSGYGRWAVLVSHHDRRWTVSEGPIRERPNEVRRAN